MRRPAPSQKWRPTIESNIRACEVVSFGGLITGDTLSTRLTLSSAGQYTIGVFRVDLLPPADPQAKAFQVVGTLNP